MLMELKQVKALASRMLSVGIERVKIVNEEKALEAMTREDVRRLIEMGVIEVKPVKGTSRGRANILAQKKKKGRRKGPGSRKGARGARQRRKEVWMRQIRAIRRLLKELKPKLKGEYRRLYRLAKGGFFRSKAHVLEYIKERGLL